MRPVLGLRNVGGTDTRIAVETMPEIPALDKSAHYAEVGGVEGVRYLQGRNYFANGGSFVREAPKEQWQPEETDEQRRNRAKKAARDAKFFAKRGAPVLPQKLLEAELENAKARAAEALA